MHTILSIYNWILDIILPQSCIGCKTKRKIICDSCILKIKRAERETETNIMACFDYREPIIKKAIWDLKYHHHFNIGQRFGEILYEEFIEEISNIQMYTQGEPIYVIPVPLYKQRQKERGYNQAKIIANGFCKSSEKEIFKLGDDIVIKQINTNQQAKLTNRNKRLSNIKGAFKVIKENDVKNKTIIVIDDVTTTGGTMTEIMKVLKKAGAKKVIGLAVAH